MTAEQPDTPDTRDDARPARQNRPDTPEVQDEASDTPDVHDEASDTPDVQEAAQRTRSDELSGGASTVTARPSASVATTAGGGSIAPVSGPAGRIGYRFLWTSAQLLLRAVLRMKIHGARLVPRGQPYVLAPVHRSNLDFLVAAMVTSERVGFMAKSSLWGKWDWFGRMLTALGAFPVNREHADREALSATVEVLRRGQPVILFPEGSRRSGGMVDELYDGAAFVACRARVPIVPVGIGGTEDVLPVGKKFPRIRKIAVVVGEPLYPDVPAEGRVPRSKVRQLTEELHERLQTLFDDAKAHADS